MVAELKTRLGAIELASSTLANPSPALVTAAVREGLRVEGLTVLPWTDAATALRGGWPSSTGRWGSPGRTCRTRR